MAASRRVSSVPVRAGPLSAPVAPFGPSLALGPGSVGSQEPLPLKPSLLGTTHVTDNEAALGYRRHPREADAQVLLRQPVTHGLG